MSTEYTAKALSGRLQKLAILLAVALLALGLAFGMQQAYAAPDESDAAATEESAAADAAEEAADDAADDAKDADTQLISTNSNGLEIGGDVFVANDQLTSVTLSAPDNLFVAGNQIGMKNGKVGADAFVAGQEISLTGSEIDNNLFIGGNSLTVSGVKAANLFLAGRNLDIDAEADNALIAGETVFLKGTYAGNVHVEATNVVIDPYLVVNGTLDVTAQQEPTIASTAKIAEFKYTEGNANNVGTSTSFSSIGSPEWLWDLGMTCLALLILGIFALLVLRTEVIDATGRILRERPLAIFVTGLLTIILLPVLAITLLIPGVTAPISMLLCILLLIATVFAPIYTAIALGRAILPRVNKWITTILFVIVFALLLSVPIVNFVVLALSVLFTAGSFIQGWWVWRRNKYDGGSFDDGGFGDFDVPRGTHANPQPPVIDDSIPAAPITQSTAPVSSDFAPRNWND